MINLCTLQVSLSYMIVAYVPLLPLALTLFVLLFHAYPLDTTILSGFPGINGHSLHSSLLLSSLTTLPLPQTQFFI